LPSVVDKRERAGWTREEASAGWTECRCSQLQHKRNYIRDFLICNVLNSGIIDLAVSFKTK
jgi:hypothetical protein